MSNQLPYVISGTVYDTDGSTAINGATVRARNETNNEIISVTSDSSGQYIFDCANFDSGYLTTDKVTVYVIYTNLEGSGSIDISEDEHELDITLATIEDSSLINYCTVQDVYDELDITDTDLSAQRVIKAVQRAEARIDERSGTKFTSTTVTEYHDFNQWTSNKSAEQLEYVGYTGRRDYYTAYWNNMFRLSHFPVVSITSLSENASSASQADSWTALTEQTGSGGDFIVDTNTGAVTFVNNIPRYGKRALKVIYVYGYATVPKQVERLTVLLAIMDIVMMRSNNSQFNNSENVSMGELSFSNSSGSNAIYLRALQERIDEAWGDVDKVNVDLV